MIQSLLYPDGRNYRSQHLDGKALTADLNLSRIFAAMSCGDEIIQTRARDVLLSQSLLDADTVYYRQQIIKDSIINEHVLRQLYDIAARGCDEYKSFRENNRLALSTYETTTENIKTIYPIITALLGHCREIAEILGTQGGVFQSDGLRCFASTFQQTLPDELFASIKKRLDEFYPYLDSPHVQISARLGQGMKSADYVLHGRKVSRRTDKDKRGDAAKNRIYCTSMRLQTETTELIESIFHKVSAIFYDVAAKLHGILTTIRAELAFYVGCVNLYQQMLELRIPVCFPVCFDVKEKKMKFENLIDIGLAIESKQVPIGNTHRFNNVCLVVVSGANQGGKSTFLRSVGCAQLMMQCGMFVAASGFSANICNGIYSHFSSADSQNQERSRLEEECARLSAIFKDLNTDSLLLMNEAFSSASEREGSEMMSEVVQALYGHSIKVILITHLYDFTSSMLNHGLENMRLLKAERDSAGGRTYKIVESDPEATSYGLDIFAEVFPASACS